MGFRKRESDLEQRLRAERPQPREEFVRSLSKLVEPVRPARRVALPKLALVGALTVVLAASLGVTGALGSAGGSVSSFGFSIVHLIAPAKASPTHLVLSTPKIASKKSTGSSSTSTSSSSSATTKPSTATPQTSPHPPNTTTNYGNATPFYFQYGFKVPICYHGSIIYVSPFQLFWYYLHGGKPYIECGGGTHP